MLFDWDPCKATANIQDHGITFEEACEAFDESHSENEPRYIRIGLSSRRLLMVVFTEIQGEVTWIISARRATRKEKRIYEKN